MGVVVTLHSIDNFPEQVEQTIIASENITIDNVVENAETRFYRNTNLDIDGYECYSINHKHKYLVEGIKWGQAIQGILKTISLNVYKPLNGNTLFSVGNAKGNFHVSALKRLSSNTQVRTEQMTIDLLDAVDNILVNDLGVKINSGWFSNLVGADLDNVFLQTEDVHNNRYWQIFRQTRGASLSNIELIIEDNYFFGGQVKVSLSKRGYIYSKKNIPYDKYIEIANRILCAIQQTNQH